MSIVHRDISPSERSQRNSKGKKVAEVIEALEAINSVELDEENIAAIEAAFKKSLGIEINA